MRRRVGLLALGCVVALALLTSDAFAGQLPVGLGTADSFAVLSGTTVTNTGFSTLNGDLGVSPGSALTGFPPGTVNGTTHAADPVAAQAQADVTTAYNDAAGRTPPIALPADVGGRTLTPGVYKADPSLGLTGTLTLDGQGDPNAVFIFQVGSALTTAVASHVNLINGAQASHVFWQIGSSATLGTSSDFAGTILALSSISMNDGVTLNGRALARNGAVTLINDTITVPRDASSCRAEFDPPQPPRGMAVIQDFRVNQETCEVISGPVRVVPADQVPTDSPDPDRVTQSLPDAMTSGTQPTNQPSARAAATAAALGCARWQTFSRVYDNNVANIKINELTTATSWCWGNGKMLSGSSPANYSYHQEKRFGFCLPTGCGWKPQNGFNRLINGCPVGCSSAEVHAHIDFSYRGLFDPTGKLFYNHLNSYPKVTGFGVASCKQGFSWRRKPPSVGPLKFFYWKPGCIFK